MKNTEPVQIPKPVKTIAQKVVEDNSREKWGDFHIVAVDYQLGLLPFE